MLYSYEPQVLSATTMMKILMTIICAIFVLTGFSQSQPDSLITVDSVNIHSTDTLKLDLSVVNLSDTTVPIWPTIRNGPNEYTETREIPNCAELVNRKGLYYLRNNAAAYCGYCVVLHSGENHSVFYSQRIYQGVEIGNFTYNDLIAVTTSNVKIISHYKNGMRDGERQYYDENAKLYKVETYEFGKLLSTRLIR